MILHKSILQLLILPGVMVSFAYGHYYHHCNSLCNCNLFIGIGVIPACVILIVVEQSMKTCFSAKILEKPLSKPCNKFIAVQTRKQSHSLFMVETSTCTCSKID